VSSIVNSLGMQFVPVPAGSFRMGSPQEEKQRSKDEEQHEVEITRPFHLGACAVAQGQFRRVMGYNPSFFSADGRGKEGAQYAQGPAAGRDKVEGLGGTDDLPVENVSWDEAVELCGRLSALGPELAAGRLYRLPTEAEWEYACRGGAPEYQVFHYGNSLTSTQANFDGDLPYGAPQGPYLGRTSKAGSYAPNAWGLFDMHGNVWEWCSDWYDKDFYRNSPRRDPAGPAGGSSRVLRGGSWDCFGQRCRSAWRNGCEPASRYEFLGFRVALVLSE
jgi:formylglycine-generating enzyme required for sulfatase activity